MTKGFMHRVSRRDRGLDGASARRIRRGSLALAATALIGIGCSGPTVPLSVGLADRPVDLLLGERIKSLEAMPVPPAVPPLVLPDFELPLPAQIPLDYSVPPTFRPTFPSWATTTSTLPVGCTAVPPERTFDDSPDSILYPPVETPKGDKGYVSRTTGEIEVSGETVAKTELPQLTTRRIENVQIHSRYPTGMKYRRYDGKSSSVNQPSDFSFDVVTDVGKPENSTRTTYRVIPAFIREEFQDYGSLVTLADGRTFQVGTKDGLLDDFFTDQNGNGNIDWDPDPTSHRNDQGFLDANENGSIDYPDEYGYVDRNGNGQLDYPDEYYFDTNGNGQFDDPDEYHVDMNNNGHIDKDDKGNVVAPDNNYLNDIYYSNFVFRPDGKFDSRADVKYKGGIYLVSMLTGTRESNRITFTKTKDAAGALVDAPGAKLAELPFVESATINTEAYSPDGATSIKFESTVFGRVDVDVCRTDLVGWKIAIDRGFIANAGQAMEFSAEYTPASQHGGLFLSEKSVMTSIQAGSALVKRTVESVLTTEPAAAADPDPQEVGSG